jgi:ABC-type amino acid transport substrate-binding protein
MTLLLAVAMMLSVAACSSSSSTTTTDTAEATEAPAEVVEETAEAAEEAEESETAIPGLEDGVLTIAMECAYAPYNWTQYDDSNGAVPISGTTGEYANGYDVMIAKMICEANGWDLEVIRTDWDSLVPGVQSGLYDAVIAGQSMTEERSQSVDFAGPYFYASIVCVTLADSEYANAQGLADLAGGSCTAQIATIWYDSMLEQIPDANIQTAAETAPAMLMALETGSVDFICTDMPTALGACAAYDDMVLLDFSGSDDNFVADEGEINIGVSVMKGNTQLKDAIDSVLSTMTVDDFNALMDEAISIQPLSE